ncbi:citryl-CoA lyase [uncultured Cohaesibacter sp.]|uniref:citryl-CoA lyase n=1 Tax=uncultured Cohaesibacter sp. TaxID=1002546 RepID=UPI0029C86BA7|nr:citryl-CoA lyase [uncultured Cohaesibacter sp.]
MTDWKDKAEAWWETSIIEMSPGVIRYHGEAIEDLIGTLSFPEMIWFMLRGERPQPGQANLLGCALVAAVDHGPQAPSIAIARMAATCGIGINGAMASAVNALGDVHGGAGEQAVEFYQRIAARADAMDLSDAVAAEMDALAATGQKFVPGFGHRFHPIDPRAPRLLSLVDKAADDGLVSGNFAAIGRAVEEELERRKGRRIPMNIDGATAVVYAELDFPPPLCRGLFILSRSVGVLAHTWEQMQRGERNKGPLPRDATWKYTPKTTS